MLLSRRKIGRKQGQEQFWYQRKQKELWQVENHNDPTEMITSMTIVETRSVRHPSTWRTGLIASCIMYVSLRLPECRWRRLSAGSARLWPGWPAPSPPRADTYTSAHIYPPYWLYYSLRYRIARKVNCPKCFLPLSREKQEKQCKRKAYLETASPIVLWPSVTLANSLYMQARSPILHIKRSSIEQYVNTMIGRYRT